jgi:hypothetical protein
MTSDRDAGSIRPLRTMVELAPLPSAVPCARRHARDVADQWGLLALARTAELLVSTGRPLARCSLLRVLFQWPPARTRCAPFDATGSPVTMA